MGSLGNKLPRRLHLVLCDDFVVDVSVNLVRLKARVRARWPGAGNTWLSGGKFYQIHTTEQAGVIASLWNTETAKPTVGEEA